ncbi:tubulin-specific chaperone A [Neocloeon triangulifer]|uniref:tubulin-specific chaperone A n=1 Tax=Neocloeon triangulifer TaxID=2078957 RepID=UPI00286F3389|nr:tubulin-specific chaperone A [Neocloeon triangulifer]
MADPRIKSLKIKSGIVKRITKEKVMYVQEAEKQDEKVQQMKEKKDDEYHIRKQEEVLAEARMMVPECHKRLVKAYEDLKNLVDCETDLNEFQEYQAALSILSDAKVQLDVAN